MQTTYSTSRAKAVAGLMAGNPADNYVVSGYAAKEALEPGRLVVLDAATGQLKVPANTTGPLTEPVIGVVAFSPSNMQTAVPAAGFTYPAGSLVPVLRKGRIWAQVSSTAEPTEMVEANVKHSSTTATDRGKFTTDATDATAGTEVADSGAKFVEKATTTLWLVELNLP